MPGCGAAWGIAASSAPMEMSSARHVANALCRLDEAVLVPDVGSDPPQRKEPMTESSTTTLEIALAAEVARMYEEVSRHPDGDYHFYTGRYAAELYGYDSDDLDVMPQGSVKAFAGVGCPIERAGLQIGERVVDLGSGAGLDSLIAAQMVGPSGRVVGIELNPNMIEAAEANRRELGYQQVQFRMGRIEEPPVEDDFADVVISNGVINLSFRKGKVLKEVFRMLKPGGRVSIVDVVSARPLSQSIVDDPKLWAS
jgi:arsenite methyltransferase